MTIAIPKKKSFSSPLAVPAALRMLGVIAVAILLLSGCTRLFFRPGKDFVTDPATAEHTPEDVVFTSADNVKLHGWYFAARGPARGTILVCHGNLENISTHVKLDLWLVDAGYNLFIFDYRGYGRSEGKPDVEGINRDAEAALETLLARTPGKVVVFGKSLGGAVAVHTVANSPYRDRVKGVIIEGTFASYRMIAREKIVASIIGWPVQYPLSFLVSDDCSPVDDIGKLAPIPVLIMHGSDDAIVPRHHGQMLYDAAAEPKQYWVLKPGHVKSWTDAETRDRLLEYLGRLN
jgi:alpha-beta hydrolase superfamily lysophospholipase